MDINKLISNAIRKDDIERERVMNLISNANKVNRMEPVITPSILRDWCNRNRVNDALSLIKTMASTIY